MRLWAVVLGMLDKATLTLGDKPPRGIVAGNSSSHDSNLGGGEITE